MADKIENAAPEEEFNDDGKPNPDYKAPAGSESGESSTIKKDADGKEIVEDKGEEGFDDNIDPTKPPEIPIRQNVAQHIIARKNEKIAKLQSKIKEGDEGYVAPTANADEGEDDDNLSDDASKAIDNRVKKAIAPLLGKMASEADEAEMRELISAEPEAAKYVNHIKAYMAHDSYKGVPPSVIFHHLVHTASQALGAKKKAAADLDAKQHKSGGRTVIDAEPVGDFASAEDIENMSDAELEKMEQDALRGKFVKK